MEEIKFKPKEYYREKIVEMINKLNDMELLFHIYRFIKNMTKEGD